VRLIRIRRFALLLASLVFIFQMKPVVLANSIPPVDIVLNGARAFTDGNVLVVSNAFIQREWRLTDQGFSTVHIKDIHSDHEWAVNTNDSGCDWTFFNAPEYRPAKLLSLSAAVSDDHRFTSKMIQVTAEFFYPDSNIDIRFVIWIYPDGPGIRTQLWAKNGTQTDFIPSGPVLKNVEHLPITFSSATAIGYYTGTEWRDKPEDKLIRVASVGFTNVNWASIIAADDPSGGIMMVKESHKCVNQPGIDTGAFDLSASGIAVSGCGLSGTNLTASAYRWCWATWTLIYSAANEDARSLALKQFDRLRYPVDTNLDIYIKANTWGSGGNPVSRASEKEVLSEIDSVADLGLDALQIDDGWQTRRMPGKHRNDELWYPRPDWYPQGWTNVTGSAAQRGIKLGLWIAYGSSLEAMKWNYDHGHFSTWKFDFANLKNYDAVADYLAQSRSFVDYTGHNIRINYDVTELSPRVGYFWARECGSIWLENREPKSGSYAFIDAIPYLILRDTWEMARYLNNNKFELPVVNFSAVDTNKSDAHLYSQTYAVALGLSGIPVFFQTTRLLSPEARGEIRDFLNIYKKERDQMFSDYVFPVGDEPDNASWTGFQWIDPSSDTGYLLVFRERLNQASVKNIPLHFMHKGVSLNVENLLTGATGKASLEDGNAIRLNIFHPGEILFLKYKIDALIK
jgi:hypothetical protein